MVSEILNNREPFSIPAQKVVQPIGDFFIASIDAEILTKIAFSDIRRLGAKDGKREVERYLGIQRPLKKNRVKEIRNYILNSRDATFPTAVIIAVDEKCAEFDEEEEVLTLKPFFPDADSEEEEIPFSQIAKVLDGQHRIDGFFEEVDGKQVFSCPRKFIINVSMFIGIDLPEQAKIFATVNLTQTKVNKSLVYDLEELAVKRNPYKTCHNVAVALDANEDSPFFERIKRLGVATPGRGFEPLTQASFVESLVKFITDNPSRDRNDILDGKKIRDLDLNKYPFNNLFKDDKDGDFIIYQIIYNYFEAVRMKWPNAWAENQRTGNLLPKSNAFKALMRFLRSDVYLGLVGDDIGRVPTIEEFFSSLDHISLSDDEFTTKNFSPGSGGESMFYKLLTGKITKEKLFES